MTAEHRITLKTIGHPANNVAEIVVQDRLGRVVARCRVDRRDLGALVADHTEEFTLPVSGWESAWEKSHQ